MATTSEASDPPKTTSSYPSFQSLPLTPSGPRGNAWGLFGPNDELGMLNHLTPDTTLAASQDIKYGIRISTDWALDEPKVPCFGRRAFEQRIIHKSPRTVNDDVLEFVCPFLLCMWYLSGLRLRFLGRGRGRELGFGFWRMWCEGGVYEVGGWLCCMNEFRQLMIQEVINDLDLFYRVC